MKRLFYIVMTMLPAMASATSYPPYEIFVGTTSETPQLTYTKVCEPGRTGEANASYVILGSYYPARQALVNTAYAGKVKIPAYIGGLPVRRINAAAFLACQQITHVEIPATVREIGARAFSDCWNLSNITFATIDMSGGTPVVSWTPVLPAAEAAKRVYTIYGRTSLLSGDWMSVPSGQESNYNFFKVRVQMK